MRLAQAMDKIEFDEKAFRRLAEKNLRRKFSPEADAPRADPIDVRRQIYQGAKRKRHRPQGLSVLPLPEGELEGVGAAGRNEGGKESVTSPPL